MKQLRRRKLLRAMSLPLCVAALNACASIPSLSVTREISPIAPVTEEAMISAEEFMQLPAPDEEDMFPLARALAERRSLREYGSRPLTLQEVSQLLWAAQGITNEAGFRTAPSAGAKYPLEILLATIDGVSRYDPREHRLGSVFTGDVREDLAAAAVQQSWIATAPIVFVITAIVARTAGRYGDRAERYVLLESGHAAQNLLLQAVALGLGGVTVGAFYDDQVSKIMRLPAGERPLYIIPVGEREQS